MSESTPAAGAGTSKLTLSVSSSTSGSSTATASPGCLNHLPTVASVTDSPRAGTRMSAMAPILFVTAGLVPALHDFLADTSSGVDARHKAGHDEVRTTIPVPRPGIA